MTANEFASYVAFQLGNADNFELKQRLILSLLFYRAEGIRRDLERNKMHPDLLQTVKVPMSLVNSTEVTTALIEDRKILRSTSIIPNPVRIKGISPFYSVSSSVKGEKKVLLTYCEIEDVPNLKFSTYTGKSPRYSYREYLYVWNNSKYKTLDIVAPFENPYEVSSFLGESFTNDNQFPIPTDMLRMIIDGLVTKKLDIVTSKTVDFNAEVSK